MSRAPVRIGLLGLGVVGSAVATALIDKRESLERRVGSPLELKRVLIRDEQKPRSLDSALLTTDPNAILDDPTIDLVVEVMGGEDPAHAYIVRALGAGKHVVTANK